MAPAGDGETFGVVANRVVGDLRTGFIKFPLIYHAKASNSNFMAGFRRSKKYRFNPETKRMEEIADYKPFITPSQSVFSGVNLPERNAEQERDHLTKLFEDGMISKQCYAELLAGTFE